MAPQYNGILLILDNFWFSPDSVISSDSCMTGSAAICGDEVIHFQFPESVLDVCTHINELGVGIGSGPVYMGPKTPKSEITDEV